MKNKLSRLITMDPVGDDTRFKFSRSCNSNGYKEIKFVDGDEKHICFNTAIYGDQYEEKAKEFLAGMVDIINTKCELP